MNITLKQLMVFTTTARLNGITKAAKELCLTQSAASQSLKELETILGVQLFNRVGRNLYISDHGTAILSKATLMLELQKELQLPQGSALQGELIVASSVTIGSYLLPRLLADFAQQHPLIMPKLIIENSEQVMAKLLAGEAHIGFIEAPLSHQSLTISPWQTDTLVAFCANQHPLASNGKITLDEIPKQRWILREHGSGTRSVFVNSMQQQGIMIDNSIELSREEAIKQMVQANLGVGVLSLLSIQQELDLGLFKQLHTPLNLKRLFSIIKSEHYQHNNLVKQFIDFLEQTTEQTEPLKS
ncbi:LysR family transcriptional regulator [Colwelliaceae bacterium BS250]